MRILWAIPWLVAIVPFVEAQDGARPRMTRASPTAALREAVAAREDKAVAKFSTASLSPGSFRAGAMTVNGVAPLPEALEISPGSISLTLEYHKPVYLAYENHAVEPLSTEKGYFPGRLVLAEPPSRPGDAPVIHSWLLFVQATREPLIWDGTDRYRTELVVGFDRDEALPAAPFPTPTTVQFLGHGSHVDVDPERVVISVVGPDGYARVRLSCGPDAISPTVEAKSELGAETRSFHLAREIGRLELSANPTAVAALGLEEADVTLRLVATDGLPLSVASDTDAIMSTSSGRISTRAQIEAGRDSVTLPLRSGSTGNALVQASVGGVSSTIEVGFLAPWKRLLFSALGGVLGALTLVLKARGKGRRTLPSAALRLLLGSIHGIVAVLAAAFGLYLTRVPPLAVNHDLGAALIGLAGGLGLRDLGRQLLRLPEKLRKATPKRAKPA